MRPHGGLKDRLGRATSVRRNGRDHSPASFPDLSKRWRAQAQSFMLDGEGGRL